MRDTLELGLDTFGDVTEAADGTLLPQAQVIRDVIAQGVLADQAGVDVFGVGEHHRADYAVSAPEIVLAAIAGQTSRMRLGTAVTVLSSDDPVRLFQRFSTLDAASSGRAEVILGRGSFTESFPLFGHGLDEYEVLFEEKLALFAALRAAGHDGGTVTWSGTVRAPLADQAVFPPLEAGRLRTWVGVGGSPQSVVRAARHGLDAHARGHRRRPGAVPAARGPVSPRAGPARPGARRGRAALARARGRHGRAGARGAVAAPPAPERQDRRRAWLAADAARRLRARGAGTARCTSARRRRWRAASPARCARWACRGST